jgi:hypothetical protein
VKGLSVWEFSVASSRDWRIDFAQILIENILDIGRDAAMAPLNLVELS